MSGLILTRRRFLGAVGVAMAAPFIVRAASLMPVRNRRLVTPSIQIDKRWLFILNPTTESWVTSHFQASTDGVTWVNIDPPNIIDTRAYPSVWEKAT